MPVCSGVSFGCKPSRPASSASLAGYETRLSSARTKRRTASLSTVGFSWTAAPRRALNAAATPCATPTFAPKRAGTRRQDRVVKTSCTGRANAGRRAACACSFDIPPTGRPATVTPRGISAGGAASPLNTGAMAAMTRTETPSRRIIWLIVLTLTVATRVPPSSNEETTKPDGGATAAASPRLGSSVSDNPPETKGRRTDGFGAAEQDGRGNRRRGQGDP